MRDDGNRNYSILAIGKKFSGKTTIVLEFAKKTGKKIVVVNTGFHPAYPKDEYPLLTLEQLKKHKGRKCQVWLTDSDQIEEVAYILNIYVTNTVIILDDAQKFVADKPSKKWIAFILNHRQLKNDVVFMYHYLSVVPRNIGMNYDFMFLFKTVDHEADLKGRYGNFRTIKERAVKINSNPDQHYCEVIYDNE